MLIQELVEKVHQNAVAHGWWEEPRSLNVVIALIHSEWSEALEEARAGRPNVYKLSVGDDDVRYITHEDGLAWVECDGKPEGIAVELIDGVIRILDAMGQYGITLEDKETGGPEEIESLWGKCAAMDVVPEDVGELVSILHAFTSQTILEEKNDPACLVGAMSVALTWVHEQGIDPLALLLEKHEYNINRPYKHGKKF